MTDLVHEELDQKSDSVTYYSDSTVVLGYISNESRRFYVYVSNCVERICRSSAPHQWKYVATNLNPADLATKSIEASKLKESMWHRGPKFLYNSLTTVTDDGGHGRRNLSRRSRGAQRFECLGYSRRSLLDHWLRALQQVFRMVKDSRCNRKADHCCTIKE